MPQSDAQTLDLSLRDRLRGLMIFRVVIFSVLLGGIIAVEAESLASLLDVRNLAMMSLVGVTYLLTVAYAALLDRLDDLRGLAQVQLAVDFALVTALVLMTNGMESMFILLFHINIINSAMVAGRSTALYSAAAVSGILLVMGLLTPLGTSQSLVQLKSPPPGALPVYFDVGLNGAAAFLIALLSGRLTHRLGETTVELEQKRDDLAQLRALTQNILASLDSGVVTVDEELSVIYFNEAASAITGFDTEPTYGEPLERLLPEISEQIRSIRDEYGHLPEGQSPQFTSDPRFECEFERPDGETIYLGYSLSVLRDSQGDRSGFIIVFQDLTDIKRLEAEKQRSQRLAAIGELAASIAHEIRNPLASISGSVEMLESVGDFDENQDDLMEIILDEVDRLDALISEFLDYSRPSSLSLSRTELDELVEDVLDLFQKQASARDLDVEFRADPSVENWTVEVDRESMRQVLWNLLNNASDALEATDRPEPNGEGPDIRVSLSEGEADQKQFYDIAIEDRGPGIDDEDRDRIFEPFFTTKENGSGLGLATSHRLIEEHGGQLQLAESSELGGARFVVRILDERADAPDAPEASTGLGAETSAPSLARAAVSEPEREEREKES